MFEQPFFEDRTVDLASGEAILLFTDGLIERNPFLRDRAGLVELVKDCVGLTAEGIAERIDEALHDGLQSLEDDVALLVLRVSTPEGEHRAP